MISKKELEEQANLLEAMNASPDYYDELHGFGIDIKILVSYLRNSVPYELVVPFAEMGQEQWDGYDMGASADRLEEWWKSDKSS